MTQGHGALAKECCVEGCTNLTTPKSARGMCPTHYSRVNRTGSPHGLFGGRRAPVLDATEVEKAWLAGVLEGEASFGVYGTGGRKNLNVAMGSTDKDVVDRVAALMGRISIPRRSREPHWKQFYVSTVTGKLAEDVMLAVLPYMGQRRSERIRECLSTPNLGHHKWLPR